MDLYNRLCDEIDAAWRNKSEFHDQIFVDMNPNDPKNFSVWTGTGNSVIGHWTTNPETAREELREYLKLS